MPPREHQLATSVLVIGTGGAGLRAAIELAETGVAVLAVGKRPVDDAHTTLATGGISAPLATVDTGDTWQQHAADTLQESRLLADPRVVQLVARDANRAIHDLERFGMRFDRLDDGRIAQRWFGAHTYRRTAFAGDSTGLQVQRALAARAARLDVPVLSTCYITRLLVDQGTVFGAYGFDLVDGSRYLVHADAVILAAGGHTRIWRRSTARRDESTGDAFRLAVDAGVPLRAAEMVQFHPLGLLEPETSAGTLVSETVRTEGGVLLNALGERFMSRYDADLMEAASRDVVARASYLEIAAGRGTQAGGVWLDLSHLPREQILTRLPRVHRTLLDLQMRDITRDPVEVTPTAHHSMGGALVRPDDNGTVVDGLYVIGEAASGLHGANRLGDNSLLELLVTGRTAAHAAAAHSAGLSTVRRSLGAVRDAETDIDRALAAEGEENVRELQRAVRNLMTARAGVVRHEAGLRAGLDDLDAVTERARRIGVHTDIGGFQDLAHAFDLRSALISARATLECAVERRETRGAHQRSDHPQLDPAMQVNLVWSPTDGVRREPLPPVPTDIASLMHDVPTEGKLLE